MPARRLPRTYFALAVVTMSGILPAMLVDHDSIHQSAPGLVLIALLLIAVARGHVVGWALLLIWNAFLVLTQWSRPPAARGRPGRGDTGEREFSASRFNSHPRCAPMWVFDAIRRRICPPDPAAGLSRLAPSGSGTAAAPGLLSRRLP